ncbi:MAG TPA: F0F1 ATP synthase subunit A [Patescibacteria group bacterium]
MAAELAAPVLIQLGPLPLTNSLLHTLLVDGAIFATVIALKKKLSLIPGGLQNAFEYIIVELYGLTEQVAGKNARIIFPWFVTTFLFLLVSNWSALLPGFGTIGFQTKEGFVPLLRSAASDINLTLSLALIVTVATHFLAIRTVGIKSHLLRYFSFNPIFLFVGLLEILSIFTNVISLSFRLFGNIFAGEVVLTTISGMFAFLLPLPFMALELIVGLVQALVFAMLTMAFMSILMTPHHAEGGEH